QQQQQQPSQGEGESEDGEQSEGEEPDGEGGRQDNQENPQGDRPEGDEPAAGDKGEDEGQGEPDDNDLKRAEKEGGDLRSRLLRKQQQEYLRNGRRIPRSKSH
ncbi:hypothetical protein N9208_02865, partial [Akkermansiaceae bacterium]|nr:hypothetical protein [Akkermansiaceae bacterium]